MQYYLLLIWSLLNPALDLLLYRGFQSTEEGSLGSPNWPKLHEQGCWGMWWNEHCQAVSVSLGELLKWSIAFEENLPREVALPSMNLYSSSCKVRKNSSSIAMTGEQGRVGAQQNSPTACEVPSGYSRHLKFYAHGMSDVIELILP